MTTWLAAIIALKAADLPTCKSPTAVAARRVRTYGLSALKPLQTISDCRLTP